jgi:hypothetical protein
MQNQNKLEIKIELKKWITPTSFFFFCRLNWSIVNTDQESTHECNLFC